MPEEPNWERNAPPLETWAQGVLDSWPHIIYSTLQYHIVENIRSFLALPETLPCAASFWLLRRQIRLLRNRQPRQPLVHAELPRDQSSGALRNINLQQSDNQPSIHDTANHTHPVNNVQPAHGTQPSHPLPLPQYQTNTFQRNGSGVVPYHHFPRHGYDERLSSAQPNAPSGFANPQMNQEYAGQYMAQNQHMPSAQVIPPATFDASQPHQGLSSTAVNNSICNQQDIYAPANTVNQINNNAPVYNYYNYDCDNHGRETPNANGDNYHHHDGGNHSQDIPNVYGGSNGGSEQTIQGTQNRQTPHSSTNLNATVNPDLGESLARGSVPSQRTEDDHQYNFNSQPTRTDLPIHRCQSTFTNPKNNSHYKTPLDSESSYKSWLSKLYGPMMDIRPFSLQVWAMKLPEDPSEKLRALPSNEPQNSVENKKRKRELDEDEGIFMPEITEDPNQNSGALQSPVSRTSASPKKLKREDSDKDLLISKNGSFVRVKSEDGHDDDLLISENGSFVLVKPKITLKLKNPNNPYFQCGKCLMKFQQSENKIGACPSHTGKFVNRVFDTDKLDCCWGLYKNQRCTGSKHVKIEWGNWKPWL
ncbi:hypothetical protein B0J14DRAFT_610361 [Halenospora varia]|nr:hypothetical protein B0J14DRAFT_610361 [Halenospora varia]